MDKLKKRLFHFIIAMGLVLFNVFLLWHPAAMVSAARDGLLMWFNNVVPALLPFAIGVHLMALLGVTALLGRALGPVMQLLFNVPGAGGFALLTGLTSGYPLGAKTVTLLRQQGQLSRGEAQRLIAFTNNAGPLFIVGFVGVGLFGHAKAGYWLLVSHVASALVVGVLFRFFWLGENEKPTPAQENRNTTPVPFWKALGESVQAGMASMVVVGGFMVLFCVVLRALELAGLFAALHALLPDAPWVTGLLAGTLEMANGARLIAQSGSAHPAALAATAALISFGGVSVHGQTAHLLHQTDIRFPPYVLAKLVQAVVAGVVCGVLVWWASG